MLFNNPETSYIRKRSMPFFFKHRLHLQPKTKSIDVCFFNEVLNLSSDTVQQDESISIGDRPFLSGQGIEKREIHYCIADKRTPWTHLYPFL